MDGKLNDKGFLLRNLMENMPDNIYFKDLQSRFIDVNRAFCEWAGLERGQVVGKTDFDLFAGEHAQQAFEDEQRIIATGEPLIGIEEKETWPDGRITWVSTSKMPLKNERGETIGTFGISRDITAHKEAELKAAYFAEQVRRIKEGMEADMLVAAELQKTFFPRSYPLFPAAADPARSRLAFRHHYHASSLVSGDFCSVWKASETQAGLFVCDVMGHGVRAALVTALVCAIIEDLSAAETDPGRFLERMNRQLFPILRQEDSFLYATACLGFVDAATGRLRVANAGHPDPLLFRGSAGSVGWLAGDAALRGPALAVAGEAAYPVLEAQVDAGDALVMYTDGLYEAEGLSGAEYGGPRLLAAARRFRELPLERLFPELINEARHFSRTGELDDDVCLVGFRVRSLSGKGV